MWPEVPVRRYRQIKGDYFDKGKPIFLVCDFRPERDSGWFEGMVGGFPVHKECPFTDFEFMGVEKDEFTLMDDDLYMKLHEGR